MLAQINFKVKKSS